MTVVIAIDQSTAATKASLFSTDGELLRSAILPHEQIYPKPGWVEHDAEEIYQNAIKVTRDLLEQDESVTSDLLCLSITNQRETIVVFEKETGKPLHNAIVWQCRRGESLCSQLIAEGHNERVQEITGLRIDTYFPASKLTWLLNHHPEIRQRLLDGTALIGTIDTYLIYRFTNGQVFATDHTNASRTLLYDINRHRWDEDLCTLFAVPIASLPQVLESSACFGETRLEDTLDRSITICGVMGDSQAALFAQRCYSPGGAKVTFGTGSSVLLNIGGEMKLSSSGIVTTIGWVLDGHSTYVFEGITNFTGGTIAWMRDQLRLIEAPEETEKLAAAVKDNGGVYLVPAFVGLSAPYWQPKARAAIVGLTPHSTKNHVVRAGLESIAYRITDVLDLMAQDAGTSLEYVNADGGAVRNRFLMQFVADMTQLTVRASSLPELSALGAALSGMLGTHIYDSLNALEQLPADFVAYQPEMNPELAREYYSGWQAAVQQVLHQPEQG